MKLYQDITFGAYSITAELIDALIKYRATKKEEELRTPEWQRLERAYLEHLIWRFQFPSREFGQRRVLSWIITSLVVVLILSGLVFSFLQLRRALEVGDFSALRTDVEITTAGKVALSSSIVGATVLVVSLVFFYLYLKHVFHIEHLLPPHVSISQTDAATVFSKKTEIKKEEKKEGMSD